MGAHDRELGVGQLARLVQHLDRHQRLAHVVQQAGQARFAAGGGIQTEGAAQRHHQRAHGHRVHIAVIVSGLQASQADQRAAVARHRIRNVLHQRQALLRIDSVAQPGLAEHRHHGCAPTLADLGGPTQFVVERGRFGLQGDGLGGRRRHCDRLGRSGGSPGHIQAGISVDPAFTHCTRPGGQQVGLARENEARAPERVVDPCPLEALDVHAQAQFGDGNLLQHGGDRRDRVPDQPMRSASARLRQQHSAAASATAAAAANTASKPQRWLMAPPATPPITPDRP